MSFKPGILALALISTACSTVQATSLFTSYDELEISRDFSSQTIGSKAFALNIVGLEKASLSSESFESKPLLASQAALLLTEQFQSLRPDLQLLSNRWVDKTQKSLNSILSSFAQEQHMPTEGYSLLQKEIFQQSWFLIADLEQDRIDQSLREVAIKDEKGAEIGKKISFVTARRIDVRYFVYDSSKQHLVFSGLVRSTTQATHDRIRTEAESNALWNALAGSHETPNDSDYPEAPGFKKALMQNFQEFVGALPKTRGL